MSVHLLGTARDSGGACTWTQLRQIGIYSHILECHHHIGLIFSITDTSTYLARRCEISDVILQWLRLSQFVVFILNEWLCIRMHTFVVIALIHMLHLPLGERVQDECFPGCVRNHLVWRCFGLHRGWDRGLSWLQSFQDRDLSLLHSLQWEPFIRLRWLLCEDSHLLFFILVQLS